MTPVLLRTCTSIWCQSQCCMQSAIDMFTKCNELMWYRRCVCVDVCMCVMRSNTTIIIHRAYRVNNNTQFYWDLNRVWMARTMASTWLPLLWIRALSLSLTLCSCNATPTNHIKLRNKLSQWRWWHLTLRPNKCYPRTRQTNTHSCIHTHNPKHGGIHRPSHQLQAL